MKTELPQLNEGEHLAGLCMVDCEPSHWVILLPAPPDKNLTWQGAIDWAKSVGGELPTRFESALLYANLRDQVDIDYWYWTGTQHEREPSWAWYQYFGYGDQHHGHKDFRGRARAVRRVPFEETP